MMLKPSHIFYSQHQISRTFGKWNQHRNTTIGETLDELCEGQRKISDIPVIQVTRKDNKWYTLDNRRLWVFHHLQAAGKCTEIPVQEVTYCQTSHGRKFSSGNGGISVGIIKRRSPGGNWHNRITPVKPTVEKESEYTDRKCEDNSEKESNAESDNKKEVDGQSEEKAPVQDEENVEIDLKTNEQGIVNGNVEQKSENIYKTIEDSSKKETYAENKNEREGEGQNKEVTSVEEEEENVQIELKANEKHSIKGNDEQHDSVKEIQRSCEQSSTGTNVTMQIPIADNPRHVDAAILNRTEWQKRIINIRTTKPVQIIHAKTRVDRYRSMKESRYKPYRICSEPRVLSQQIGFRGVIYTRRTSPPQFCLAFRQPNCDTEDSESVSSENEFSEDELDMLVDDTENASNEIKEVYDEEDDDAREIDYDDEPLIDEESACTGLEPDYDQLDVWDSECDKQTAYYHFPDSSSDSDSDTESDSEIQCTSSGTKEDTDSDDGSG